jgi:hypothetical protein
VHIFTKIAVDIPLGILWYDLGYKEMEDFNVVKSNMVIQEMKIRADRAYQLKLKAAQESHKRALVLDKLAKDLLTKTKNNEVSDDEE